MPYQSFLGEEPGDSDSPGKLNSLYLPDVKGLSILDIGCNEGYFCFELLKRGAAKVIGMDINEKSIQKARKRAESSPNNNCVTFLCQNWNNLPDEKFDLILCLSSLHYAEDQFTLIDNMMEHVNDSGTLILECGVHDAKSYDFVTIDRIIDQRRYPTIGLMKNHLNQYAFRFLTKSIQQKGDPVDRWVIHVKHKRGTCIVVTGPPMSGKTTLARTMGSKGMNVLSLDNMLVNFIENNPVLWGNFDISKCRVMLIDYYEKINREVELCQRFIESIASDFNEKSISNDSNTLFYFEGYGFNLMNINSFVSEFLEMRGFILWYLTRPLIEKGELDNVSDREVKGWAYSNSQIQPNIKICVNDNYVGEATTNIERDDVRKIYPDSPITSGFLFQFPEDLYFKKGDEISARFYYPGSYLNYSPLKINTITKKRRFLRIIKKFFKRSFENLTINLFKIII